MSFSATFLTTLFTIVVPIFLVAAVAFLLAKRGIITEQRPLARVSLYFFSPALAFQALSNSNINGADVVSIVAFVLIMALIVGALCFGISRGLKFDRRLTSAFLLSILFVNAGNYGIPLIQFAFGSEGVARAAIFFATNSILSNTLAVYIATAGHSNMRSSVIAVLKMPLAYAALAGIAFNALGIKLPLPIARGIELAAAAALPVMLVNLGLELARAKLQDYDWNVFLAVGIKLLVTPIIALGLAAVMGMTGLTRSVSVLEAAMPTAVVASLIATEFQARSDFVTSVVFLTTIGSTLTLTLLLMYLGYMP